MRLFQTARSSALLAGFVLTSLAAHAQLTTWKIDPAHSGVNFQIKHLGVSTVRGSFSNVTGTVKLDDKNIVKSSVDATIDATTVNTGQSARDTHLKSPEFFDVAKNPTITFKSTSLTSNGGKLMMTGDLTLNGVTKPVTLAVDGPAAPQKGPRGGVVSGFSATGSIKRSDFNFGGKYGPPMLGDEVPFTIDIEMTKE